MKRPRRWTGKNENLIGNKRLPRYLSEPLGIKIIWGDRHANILTKKFFFLNFSFDDLLWFTFVVVVMDVDVDVVVVDVVDVDVVVVVDVVDVVDVVGVGPK